MSRLQDEIKKKQPFASLQQEAMLSLAKTNDQISIRFERLFRTHGLTPSQYNILRILRGEGKPMPVLEIAERTITVVPGITGLIDRLERAGFVGRKRCDEDRRVVFVSITPQGSEALAKLAQPVQELHRDVMQQLSEDELQTLIGLLEKARESILTLDR